MIHPNVVFYVSTVDLRKVNKVWLSNDEVYVKYGKADMFREQQILVKDKRRTIWSAAKEILHTKIKINKTEMRKRGDLCGFV